MSGRALRSTLVLVDTKCFDKALNQVVYKDQYSPGYALDIAHGSDLLSFEVIPIKGGLIQAFKLNGTSVVLNKPFPDELDGSIFWPSPQSAWGWPPPVAIDPVPSKDFAPHYAVEVDPASSRVTLTSPIAPSLGLRIRKSFSADTQRGAIVLDYEIVNVGTEVRSFAPWEVTRVPKGGLSFFVGGEEEKITSSTWPPLMLETVAGATWFQQNSAIRAGGKMFASAGRGWLAHVSNGLLLVKCFDVVPTGAMAPGESQIELYDGGDYVELETQGAYAPIPPGGALSWRVLWYLRRAPVVPAGAQHRAALVVLAGGLCSGDPAGHAY